jgi:hypothetical protein
MKNGTADEMGEQMNLDRQYESRKEKVEEEVENGRRERLKVSDKDATKWLGHF